jgi:hypothetical protein
MLGTADPGSLGFEDGLDRSQVQCPPTASTLAPVVPGRPSLAPAAPAPSTSRRSNSSDQNLLVLVVLDRLNDRLLDPEQGAP